MATLFKPFDSHLKALSGHKPVTASQKAPEVTVQEIEVDEVDASVSSPTQSLRSEASSRSVTTTSSQHIKIIEELVVKQVTQLESRSDTRGCVRLSCGDFLDLLAGERLRRLPRKGGKWDRVLKWAEELATHLTAFQRATGGLFSGSQDAVELMYAACWHMIELGPSHAVALEKSFSMFYEAGQILAFFCRHRELLHTAQIKTEIATAFSDLTLLVTESALFVRRRSHELCGEHVSVDIHSVFRRTMASLVSHRNSVANMIWTRKLQVCAETRDIKVEIHEIRQWLSTTQLTRLNSGASHLGAMDHTCDWFSGHLLDFLRGCDDLLHVTGGRGCGKSVLTSWLVDRFQRPINKRQYHTVLFQLDQALGGSDTAVSVVKTLVLQMLEQNVGDVNLFKSLVHAFELSSSSSHSEHIEASLWAALDASFKKAENLIVIVDGLNEVKGGIESQNAILNRIHSLVTKHAGVRAIALSEKGSTHLTKTKTFHIETKHVRTDIEIVIRKRLATHFNVSGHSSELSLAVSTISERCSGSFVTASIIYEAVKVKKTITEVIEFVKHSGSILDIVRNTVVSAPADAQKVLAWLLVSKRPLTTRELTALLEIDVQKNVRCGYVGDIRSLLKHSCGGLVEINYGTVRFTHSTIREQILELVKSNKVHISLSDAHEDLLCRALLHVKLSFHCHRDVSYEGLEQAEIEDLFNEHSLLKYAVHYWTSHFEQTSMWQDKKLNLTTRLRYCFPQSVAFSLIEKTCWASETKESVVRRHTLAIDIRETVFGKKSCCVLQSMLSLAIVRQSASENVEASKLFFKVFELCKTVFGTHHAQAISCAETFLECTKKITVTERTDLVTLRETVLKHMISHSIHIHGEIHESTLQYRKTLALLYKSMGEIVNATSMFKILHECTIRRFGWSSAEVKEISKEITTIVKSHTTNEKHSTVTVYEASLSFEITDVRRYSATINMIEYFESSHDLIQAEQLFLSFWTSITTASHHHHSRVECHDLKLKIVLEYCSFLERHKRIEEAKTILIGLWMEYEHVEYSETISKQMTMIGRRLKTFGFFSAAMAIFSSVWSYFKRTKKSEVVSTEVKEIASLITETATCTSTDIVRKYTSVLTEVFETTTTVTTTTKTVDITTIRSCQSLSTLHMSEGRFSECIETCKKLLTRLWASSEKKLPAEHRAEVIELSIRQAICYKKMEEFTKCEETLIKTFHAAISSLHAESVEITTISKELLKFYAETSQEHKCLSIYDRLVEGHRKTLGVAHAKTIDLLYEQAFICVRHDVTRAQKIYAEIVEIYSKESTHSICHVKAWTAATALCKIHFESKNWTASRKIFDLVWETIVHRSKEYAIKAEFIQEVFTQYTRILVETKVEVEVQRKVTVQYRETVVKVFGASHELSIMAGIALAEFYSRHTQYQERSIKVYEEVIEHVRTSKVTISTTISEKIVTAKTTLTKLYKVHASTSTTVSQRAITMHHEEFQSCITKFGFSHSSTITALKELIEIRCKHMREETRTITIKELQTVVIGVISTESDSKRLYECGLALAELYHHADMLKEGRQLILELRRQIISRDASGDAVGFSIHHEKLNKSSYLFLAAFEERLHGVKISFSACMSEMMTEKLLFERYRSVLKQDVKIEILLCSAASLRAYLHSKGRSGQIVQLEETVFETFSKTVHLKASSQIVRRFCLHIMEAYSAKASTEIKKMSHIACQSGIAGVRSLLEAGQFYDALEHARFVHSFVRQHGGYHGQIEAGLALATLLAGRTKGVKFSTGKLVEPFTVLSEEVLRDVLSAAHHCKYDFLADGTAELSTLSALIGLFGMHHMFAEVEALLTQLWEARDTQRRWSPSTVVGIGRRLVEVRFAHGNRDKAIALCEDMCYNLRRVWGLLDATTVSMYNLLSALYTAAHRHADALAVHDELLHETVLAEDEAEDDETLPGGCRLEPAVVAKGQLALLRQAYRRAGKWTKPAHAVSGLADRLLGAFGAGNKDLAVFEHVGGSADFAAWDPKKIAESDGLGCFHAPEAWEFILDDGKGRHVNLMGRRSLLPLRPEIVY